MLPLDDPRWKTLRQCHGDAGEVPGLLRTLLARPEDSTAFDALHEALLHQGNVYSASFAALHYLAQIVAATAPANRLSAVLLAADIVAAHAAGADLPDIPEVRDDVTNAATALRPLTLEMLACTHWDEVETRYLLAACAALIGHPRIHAALQGLDDLQCPECAADLTA